MSASYASIDAATLVEESSMPLMMSDTASDQQPVGNKSIDRISIARYSLDE